ncbi:tetratricopeptide repeat protein [Patescibacteria group bacterium]|nr:tetratricopeptide repeat protein [Patescibacteria group bacterium]
MNKHLKRVGEFLESKVDKKKLRIYCLLGGIGIAVVVGFWIYVTQMKKLSFQKFGEATSYYMEAKGQEEKEEAMQGYKKAKSLYEQLLSQHWIDNRDEVLFNLANCLYVLGEYDGAGAALKKLTQSYQNSYFLPWAELKLAGIYEKEKKYSLAIEVYKKIQEKYGDSSIGPEATIGIARCQELLGNKEEALKSYQTLISRYPLSMEAKIGEMKISKLK